MIGLMQPFVRTSLSGACGRVRSLRRWSSPSGWACPARRSGRRWAGSPRKDSTTAAGGRGVVVTDISLESIDELFELRETLEVRAAALAAQRGEPGVFAELHAQLLLAPELLSQDDPARHDYYALVGRLDEAIDAAVSNSYLAHAMRSLRVHLVRVRRLAADDAARLHAAAAEHAAIAEAIAAGNPRLAEAATTLHLHRSLTHVKAAHLAR